MRRPSLPHPPRLRLPWNRRETGEALAGSAARIADEDSRILRRTRLRLMAWSGGITLVVLVVLGAAAYAVSANAFASDSTNRLVSFAKELLAEGTTPTETSPYEVVFGGDRAGTIPVVVSADQKRVWPRGLPVGLPNSAGVKIALAGGTDIRTAVVTVKLVTSTSTITQDVPVRIYSAPIFDSSGAVIGVIETCADRTQEVQLLGTLFWVLLIGGGAALLASLFAGYLYAGRALVPIRQSIDRRQGALQRQREFAANASHELRTPLTVIAASVEDLRRNRRSRVEEVGEALGDIDAEVRHMTALVADMLLLARTDSGVVQIDKMNVDLEDVAADAVSGLAALGEEHGVAVVLDPLPVPMMGDPVRLRQLVTILVDNAIRHSLAGSNVTVIVRPEPGQAMLRVDDEGHGIKPENLPHVFERFWRADDAPAGGTGLGLAIAKWIVDQHGGTIEASNRPEGGASFLVKLPIAKTAPEPHAATADAPSGAGFPAEPGPGSAPGAAPDEPAHWSPNSPS
jgi:two-component system, OmpR family, sensor histidine kinase CiaH